MLDLKRMLEPYCKRTLELNVVIKSDDIRKLESDVVIKLKPNDVIKLETDPRCPQKKQEPNVVKLELNVARKLGPNVVKKLEPDVVIKMDPDAEVFANDQLWIFKLL